MTNNETKAASLRAAINERAERLRKFEHVWLDGQKRALKSQIRDLELELSEITL